MGSAPPPGRPQRSDPQLRLTFTVTRPQRPAGRQHAQSQRHGQPVRGPHPPPPSAAAAFAGLNRARRAKQPPGPGRAPWLPIGWRPPTRSHTPFPHWSTRLGAHKSGSTLPFLIGWWHRPPSALDSCRPLIEPGLLAGSGRRGGGSGSVAIFGRGRGCGRAGALQAGVGFGCCPSFAQLLCVLFWAPSPPEEAHGLLRSGPDSWCRSGALWSAATLQAGRAAGRRQGSEEISFLFLKGPRGLGNQPLGNS